MILNKLLQTEFPRSYEHCKSGTWSQGENTLSDRHMHTLTDLVYDVARVLAKSNSVVVIQLLGMVKKRVDAEVMSYQQHHNDKSETSVDAMEDGMIDDEINITAVNDGMIDDKMDMSGDDDDLRIIVLQIII